MNRESGRLVSIRHESIASIDMTDARFSIELTEKVPSSILLTFCKCRPVMRLGSVSNYSYKKTKLGNVK